MLTLGSPLSLTPIDFRTSITKTAGTQVIAENTPTPTTVPGCTPPNEAGERFYWNGSEWAKVQPHQRCTNDRPPQKAPDRPPQKAPDRPPQEASDPNAAPNAATPQVPPELTPEPAMKWWHWGLLIGAGAGVGYFLLRRR